MADPEFRKVGETPIYSGYVIDVVTADFVAPNGETITRDVVKHPGAVSVVPVVGDEVVLVRQFRAACEQWLLEIPAGKRDVADEPPAETARRELIEEVGLEADELELLAEFYNAVGFCNEYSYVFVAVDPTPVPTNHDGVEEEFMTVERIKLDDVPALIANQTITDSKTIIGLLLAKQHLASRNGAG